MKKTILNKNTLISLVLINLLLIFIHSCKQAGKVEYQQSQKSMDAHESHDTNSMTDHDNGMNSDHDMNDGHIDNMNSDHDMNNNDTSSPGQQNMANEQQVFSLVQSKCYSCHGPNGHDNPRFYADSDIRKHKSSIVSSVLSNRMPKRQGAVVPLQQHEKTMISNWNSMQ